MNTRVIIQYTNRKFYDKTLSKYVTLPEIAQFIKQGDRVQIIESTTRQDLTKKTLTSVLNTVFLKSNIGINDLADYIKEYTI